MSEKDNALRFGPLSPAAWHLCVDMQRLFAEDTEWATPWMRRVLPQIEAVCEAMAARTAFTRFIPARSSEDAAGTWRRYYERWSSMTLDRLGEDMVALLPELQRFVPPATLVDKGAYSPWYRSRLPEILATAAADTVVVTGGETDICVLATVLGAIDRGYRVVVVTDAVCSSADETHDASMVLFLNRFGQQVETVTTDVLLAGLS